MQHPRAVLGVLLGGTVAAACAGRGEPAPPAADLHASCIKRVAWARATTSPCVDCNARATARCGCTNESYEGKCQGESMAKGAEADCTSTLSSCVSACGSDCTCQDGCYVGHASCRVAATNLESCLASVCDPLCR